jgi:hypothetical protein
MGLNLNSGLFHSAHIPDDGFHLSLEMGLATVFFGEDSRYFEAITEEDFTPEQTVRVPTVVGPTKSVELIGDYALTTFPGGFDVDNFPVAVPQLRVGAWHGTEAVLRFLLLESSGSLLNSVRTYGLGVRHSLSQYMGVGFPADVALAGSWQSASLGFDDQDDDVIKSDAYSVGLHASKAFGDVVPYGGVSVDWFNLDLSYQVSMLNTNERIDLSFETGAEVHYTFGFSYSIAFIDAYGEYNLANQNALNVGLAFQYTSSDRSVGP